jgi:outer membrane protein OmpA-like peptidoglycan-associated protein
MNKVLPLFFITGLAVIPLLNGCSTTPKTSSSHTVKGGTVSTASGIDLSAILGNKPESAKEDVKVDTGTTISTFIGQRLDQQTQALKTVPGVAQVDYDEANKNISANMQVLFRFDSAKVEDTEQEKLDKLAEVFTQYPENVVVIEGHTDNLGKTAYNQKLSEERAATIEQYLRNKNLNLAKISSVGFGETQPLVANDTPENRHQNRRVNIKISVDSERAQKIYEEQQAKNTGTK